MKNFALLIIFLFLPFDSYSQTPTVSTGKIVEYLNFNSKNIGSRNIRVWLPDGYNTQKKYKVLYANDGQMLWDGKITWNKQEWKLDEVLGKLIKEKKVKPTIVVAIDNADANRHPEYFPQKPFESLSKKTQDSLYALNRSESQIMFATKVYSDRYLKFLVEELKPFIDDNYATLTDADNTFIMGSSMGGLISMYAQCEYPDIFGGSICMSTHWIGIFNTKNNPIPKAFQNYMLENLPHAKNHKFYFDFGTETLDAKYEPFQQEIDEIMKKKKYRKRNWKTLKFSGADHSENAWAERLNFPLIFMLK